MYHAKSSSFSPTSYSLISYNERKIGSDCSISY
jgi:hypothetical protein